MNNLLDAAINFGLVVDHIDQDEQLHRVATLSKPNGKNGWYVAYGDLIIMGDWQTGITETFKPDGHSKTKQDQERIKQSIERHRREKQALQQQTAKYASQTYYKASQVAVHPYITNKGLDSAERLKLIKNQLIVPLYNLKTGNVENLQRIFPDGTKRFLKNGRISGLCCPCGLLNTSLEWPEKLDKVFICEGYATAASIFQMTHQPVLAAMNAGNLLHVGKAAKAKWPNIELVIAGDDDHITEKRLGVNTGKVKAIEAASILCAKVSFPPFSPKHKSDGLTDWNDYFISNIKEVA